MQLTREQVREMDRTAIEEFGIPGIILMENAGLAVTREVWRTINSNGAANVVILCGKGNNGGDGYVVARHLFNRGMNPAVFVFSLFDEIRGDAAINLSIIRKMRLNVVEVKDQAGMDLVADKIRRADAIVDALLGTGLTGEVKEPMRHVIEQVNELMAPVLAVDIPSGLDANTGEVFGVCVKADTTVTFVGEKEGFARGAGPLHTGRIVVAEISIPRQVVQSDR